MSFPTNAVSLREYSEIRNVLGASSNCGTMQFLTPLTVRWGLADVTVRIPGSQQPARPDDDWSLGFTKASHQQSLNVGWTELLD